MYLTAQQRSQVLTEIVNSICEDYELRLTEIDKNNMLGHAIVKLEQANYDCYLKGYYYPKEEIELNNRVYILYRDIATLMIEKFSSDPANAQIKMRKYIDNAKLICNYDKICDIFVYKHGKGVQHMENCETQRLERSIE